MEPLGGGEGRGVGVGHLGEATLLGSLADFARVSLQHTPILLTMFLIFCPSITLHIPHCRCLMPRVLSG